MSIRIGMHGASGRMGRTIIRLVDEDEATSLTAAVDRAGGPTLGTDAGLLAGCPEPLGIAVGDDLDAALASSDVLIDFSLPEGTQSVLAACRKTRHAVVVGTTGLGTAGDDALRATAEVAPVLFAPNFSVGVNVFWALSRRAASMLGEEFDMEIVEMHHRHKVDAPSGTAVRLTEAVAEARGLSMDSVVPGRSGSPGPRKTAEIGVHALRGGDVVGDHTLVMAGPGERVELTHRAHTREIFARGAIRAAKWLAGRAPGLYGMGDVLGLE